MIGMDIPRPIARDLLEEEDGVLATRVPLDDNVWTVNEVVCFCAREEEDALMSTWTDCALLEDGVPEIVRVLLS